MPAETDAKTSQLDGLKIGLYDAAKLIGKSIQHVRNLVKAGFIEQPVDGKYSPVSVASGALKAREAEDRRASKTAASSRLNDERAEEIRLRRMDREKVLVEQAQIEAVRVIDEVIGPLRADLTGIPAQVTADLKLRRQIEDRIDAAFGAATKRASAAADRVKPSGAAARASRKNNRRSVGKRKPRVSAKRGRAGEAGPKPDAVHRTV